jgi:putative FmdB family regulatory protein
MPIFEFKCKNCGHIFEEFVFSSNPDAGSIICPECSTKNTEKLMSAFSSAGSASVSSAPSSCSRSGFG